HALVLRKRGDSFVAEEYVARRRHERAGEEIDERRLAGAVRSDQRMTHAVRKRKRDVAVRPERTERFGETRGAERRRGHARVPRRRSRNVAMAPRMPPRANSTTTTSRSPSQNCQ